jgi:hypothetical protein
VYYNRTFDANIILINMKKIFISALLLTALSGSTIAEPAFDRSRGNVRAATQARFTKDFEGAEKVTWEISYEFQKATFTLNGNTVTAFYDWSHTLKATTQYIDFVELPAQAIKNLLRAYPDHQVEAIIRYDDGHTVYFLNLKKGKADFLVRIEPDYVVQYFKSL